MEVLYDAVHYYYIEIFLLDPVNLMGWQARGFDGEFNNASIKALMFSADRENFLLKVAETRGAYRAQTEGRRGG